MALATNVENRTEALDLLRSLSRRPRAPSSQFFERLVELLPAMFGAELALIAQVTPGKSSLRTVALMFRGRRIESVEQAHAGSASLDVMRLGHLFIAASAGQRYPDDGLLREFSLEAFHGVSLLDDDGHASGVVAVGHTGCLELTPDAEFLLELLAQRISADWTAPNPVREPNAIAPPDAVSHVTAHPIGHIRVPGPGDAPIPREMLGIGSPSAAQGAADMAAHAAAPGPLATELTWYRRYFELGTPGMALAGLNGDIWDVNESLCEMLKRSRSEVLASKWTELTHGEDLPNEYKLLSEVAEGRSEGYSVDKRLCLPDGSTLLANVAVRCSRRPNRRVEYLTMLVQDLTHQRLLEQQLLHSQKLEAVGRLAGGIAHDFNNLLTAILGYTDMTSSADEQAVSEMLSGVRDAALRAANLTSQLLAFARRQVIEPKVLDLNRVVQSTTHLLRRIVGEDVEIVTGIAADLWSVRLDPGQVEQILVNMAVNARDAMPKGGRLLIGTGNVPSHMVFEVLGPTVPVEDYVLVIIADGGQGMDPDTLNHLFEPFFTTKEASKGSGLGLATCHGIVSQNRGQIRVTSSIGYGTTFRIYFPRYSAEPVSAPSVPPSSPTSSIDETILLVEDDEMVRRVAVRVLKSKGYNVLSAASGVEALEVARGHSGHIDLLLTDLVMPKMNGDRLAHELLPLRPKTKVLFTSGYAESAHDQGLGPGANFLQKPYTPRQLGERVRKILDK
jgi:two-component system, cell cycle sensor histidine kinase and response regulator CckA